MIITPWTGRPACTPDNPCALLADPCAECVADLARVASYADPLEFIAECRSLPDEPERVAS